MNTSVQNTHVSRLDPTTTVPRRQLSIPRFNNWLAIRITKSVGSMWCAYLFALIALVSLPSAINSHDPIIIISWIAQTFLQLILLPIIIVGQNVQAAANDARDESDHQMLRAIRALSLGQLGEKQLVERNLQSALLTYQEAYDLDHSNPNTNYYLGALYTEFRKLDRAVEHLHRALEGNRENPAAEASLAFAIRLQADGLTDPDEQRLRYGEAEQLFMKALKQDPSVRDINGESFQAVLGGLYKKMGDVENAIEAYKKAEYITPQQSYPVVNLAMLHYLNGNLVQAKKYYERCAEISLQKLEKNPFDYWTRFDLVTAQLVGGNLEQALWEFNRAAQNVTQYVRHTGPLGTFMRDLQKLRTTPNPPNGIDEIIDAAKQAIKEMPVSAS